MTTLRTALREAVLLLRLVQLDLCIATNEALRQQIGRDTDHALTERVRVRIELSQMEAARADAAVGVPRYLKVGR